MTDTTYLEQPKRWNFSWVPEGIFRPKKLFTRISTISSAVWMTPLLVLSIFVVINVAVSGRIKSQAALMGEITFPPDYQYYTPEQQAQYMQAIQSTQGPVFVYVLPGIAALIGVWLGWLLLGGILHLSTTLSGGRGSTILAINIVAWASLPLAIREVVQLLYMLFTKTVIQNPGLSGFSVAMASGWQLFLSHILKLIDIYLIWQCLLIILGVHLSTKLNKTKSTFAVLIAVFIILLLQTGLAYLISVLGNLTITRPFFF
jgi:hypothetical protein